MSDIADWPRPYFTTPAGEPFLFYVAYGQIPKPLEISASKYWCAGIPSGIEMMQYGPERHPDVVSSFRSGYLWETLQRRDPDLAASIARQEHCVVIRGALADAGTLNDFRDVIGLLTCLLDSGCVALYDPQMFAWWAPAEWRREIFEPGCAAPRQHVVILTSDEDGDTEWIHTRGMRKFGRPDLSVHRVPAEHRDAVIDLCNRFIELQAFGGAIAEGQPVRMHSLPPGVTCHHRGSVEDPDFNNVHVEIEWPAA